MFRLRIFQNHGFFYAEFTLIYSKENKVRLFSKYAANF
ncbi:hypothetical protein LEP1GSC037_1959 [Leptospira interrogans str. 2006001854]|uniref:Uncharacterized protein n=1 Tax=Leptospira interrogans str. 2006001854 TaxID=1001590 RepID=M6GIR0_LEPIR|nr:hypothetical protein LEP1GSC037_1959 [Leptospira interrogans str. 2006001854]EMN80010.1 hypothetical protein LEP1GSC106_4587 [Leptospira interrogans serovar Grippotyphosa str. UI 12764]